MSEIFECECGLKVPMKQEEFPLHCKCGRTSYNVQETPVPKWEERIELLEQEYKESPDGLIRLEDITACITTYRRVGCLEKLVESIKQYYPDLKIDIIDTEGNLSWGRNQLVQRCTTKYCLILEDDFEFTKNTKIGNLYVILKQDDTLGLIGGEIINDSIRRFQGRHMNLFRGVMEYTISQNLNWKLINNIRYKYCDYISNFFLARIECLKENPWDEELALMEHVPWFWMLKQQKQYKVGYTDGITISHHKDRSDPIYNESRNNVKKYNEIIKQKYNINSNVILKPTAQFTSVNISKDMETNVYSLWIGAKLPRLQNLCIKSWLAKGYKYKLFVYEDVENIPDGVDLLDGSEFIKEIYLYKNASHMNNPALHANYFRYKWLYKNGGTWLDIDTACIQRLSDDIIIFSSEPTKSQPYWHPNVAITRVPINNVIMEGCLYYTEKQIKERCFDRGFFGPKLIKYILDINKMLNTDYVSTPDVFCPYSWWLTQDMYRPYSLLVPVQSIGIHLWNNTCVKNNIDIYGLFNPMSMYEKLWTYLGVE